MIKYTSDCSGGETGIRTLGTREGSTVFETAPFDHSGTSPRGHETRLVTQRVEGKVLFAATFHHAKFW
jgi:hypothetical protein